MTTKDATPQGFELLEHTADAGVRAWGPTLESLFQAAAQGLYALALSRPAPPGGVAYEFSVPGETHEDLLHRFLAELVFLLSTHEWVAKELSLTFSPNGLIVAGHFSKIPSTTILREIKSPTYHRLQVRQEPGRWSAEVYFDL